MIGVLMLVARTWRQMSIPFHARQAQIHDEEVGLQRQHPLKPAAPVAFQGDRLALLLEHDADGVPQGCRRRRSPGCSSCGRSQIVANPWNRTLASTIYIIWIPWSGGLFIRLSCKLAAHLVAGAALALAQYKLEPPAPIPPGTRPPIAQTLSKDGWKVVGAGGAVVCEVWFAAASPRAAKSSEESVTLPEIPHGALLGAIRYPANGADRRGRPSSPASTRSVSASIPSTARTRAWRRSATS